MTSKTPASKPAAKKAPAKAGSKGGRPTTYTVELGERICTALMEPCSLNKVCKRAGMPQRAVVYRWLLRHEEFRVAFEAAIAVRLDLVIDETIDIADAAKLDPASISRAKLQIDARWRMAERLAPRKYGQRQQIDQNIHQLTHEQWLEHLA